MNKNLKIILIPMDWHSEYFEESYLVVEIENDNPMRYFVLKREKRINEIGENYRHYNIIFN